jgi:hypothetical protein
MAHCQTSPAAIRRPLSRSGSACLLVLEQMRVGPKNAKRDGDLGFECFAFLF